MKKSKTIVNAHAMLVDEFPYKFKESYKFLKKTLFDPFPLTQEEKDMKKDFKSKKKWKFAVCKKRWYNKCSEDFRGKILQCFNPNGSFDHL